MLTHVLAAGPHASVGVIGFQPPVAAIYRALKFDVGELTHYVLANPDVSNFEIASFARPPRTAVLQTDLTADVADHACLAQPPQSVGERTFRERRVRPVDLVEVDDVDAEPLQAGRARGAHVLGAAVE